MKRQRGISTIGSIVLAALGGLTTASVVMDWMVIKVDTPEPGGVHLTIPFPLVAADVAGAFLPEEIAADMAVPEELKAQRAVVTEALSALAEAPDGVFVEVTSDQEQVRIAKKGSNLLIDVEADDARVHCNLPLVGLSENLSAWDWDVFDPQIILSALHDAPRGVLVDVDAEDGTTVTITKW